MTLLNQIITTTTTTPTTNKATSPQTHFLPFTPTKPNLDTNTNSFISPLPNFNPTQQQQDQDISISTHNNTFYNTLQRKLKSAPHSLTSNTFLSELLIPFLLKLSESKQLGKVTKGVNEKEKKNPEKIASGLVGIVGKYVGKGVFGLVIDGCLSLGCWVVLESVIGNGFVEFSDRGDLVSGLVERGKFDVLCLCLRCFGDFDGSVLSVVLKGLLGNVEKDRNLGVERVRKEWESEALAAIRKVEEGGKMVEVAKEAAVLLMMAYDGFSDCELCLHFVLASGNVDDVVFAGAVRRLDSEEGLRLVRYLGKWLRKYERFPEARPCDLAESGLGLKLCKWVPKVEDVVKCLGVVVDEGFSMLALHPQFHQEVKAIGEIVDSLVADGRVCCSIANVVVALKPEVGSE